MANETVLVDLGPSSPGMVVRLPPLEPTFPDYELGPQAIVQNAVAAVGVPAPAPAVVEHDPTWVGAPFLVMPRVRGDVPGPAPFLDPYVREAGPVLQRLMHDGLIDTLADVHAVPWRGTVLEDQLPGVSLRDTVDRWAAYVAWSSEGDPLPALAEALEWCTRSSTGRAGGRRSLGRRAAGQPRVRPPSAGCARCSTGTWPPSGRPRWTSAGISASSS